MMQRVWKVEFDADARADFLKLSTADQRRIRKFIGERLVPSHEPEKLGKALSGKFICMWRFRVGDYRLIARIENLRVVIVIITIAHRSKVYR